MARLSPSQLENVLDQLFKHMQEKGIEISEDQKREIKKEFTSELTNVSHDEVNDPKFKLQLMGAITAYTLGNKKDFDERIHLIKNREHFPLKPELELKIKNELKMLALALLMVKEAVRENNPILLQKEFTPVQLAKELLKRHPDKNNPEKKEEMNELEKQMSDTLRNLFGGDDPRQVGEVVSVVFLVIGNLPGFTNQTQPNFNSNAFMTKAITYNSQDTDPLGLENIIKNVEDLSEGIELNVPKQDLKFKSNL